MKKHTYQYIIITDPLGAECHGVFEPVNHRAIIVDRSSFFGMENVGKKFSSEQSFLTFARALLAAPSGTHINGYTWVYDGPPQDKLP